MTAVFFPAVTAICRMLPTSRDVFLNGARIATIQVGFCIWIDARH